MTTTTTTTLAPDNPAAAPPANGAAVSGAAVPPANPVGSASTPAVAAPPVGAPSPRPERFGYVAQSSPAELAANVERAIQSITVEAGGSLPCEQGALAARDLCEALKRFLWPEPAAERVGAFWGVFPDMVAFLHQVGEPPFEPPGAAVDLRLDKVLDSPVGRLGLGLFSAHRRLGKEGGDFDAELLAGLELALETYGGTAGDGAVGDGTVDSETCSPGMEALAGLLGYESGYLFRVDADWTQQRVFALMARGSAYRLDAARMLVRCGSLSSPEFVAGLRPLLFELCEDAETVFGAEFGPRIESCEWLLHIAEEAYENNDAATIAQITDLLRVMSDLEKGNFIGQLGYRFDGLCRDDYERLSDRELHKILAARLRTAQFIRTVWPTEPECQTEEATVQFVDLIFDAGDYAEEIFEACRDFLVPITKRQDQGHVYSMLVHGSEEQEACVQANPTIMAGIIDRTTNEHSIHLEELTELKTHITAETPPIDVP